MVSLRRRDRESLLNYLRSRTSKMPVVLDTEDFTVQLGRAVQKLDELMFNPRSVLFNNASDGLLDVTAFNIDEISTVYYSPDNAQVLMGGMDLGVGLMPILTSSSMPVGCLDSLVDYLIFKNVINLFQRKMLNTCDYTLMPMTVDGKQLLQVRNPGNLFWVEFLPWLDPGADGWDLFENETQFLQELAFAYICLANAEIQMQAINLGVGKEAQTLTTYWSDKIEKLIKSFEDSSIISYIG